MPGRRSTGTKTLPAASYYKPYSAPGLFAQAGRGIAENFAQWFYDWSAGFTREEFDDILDFETGGMLEICDHFRNRRVGMHIGKNIFPSKQRVKQPSPVILFRWSGDPAYLDYQERNLYNGIMAQAYWEGN